MTQLEQLEQNVLLLMSRYQDLQQENQRLRDEVDRQRSEVMRTHTELVELQQQYKHLHEAHALTATPENKEKAYQQLTSLIRRVDQAIEVLKK